MSDVERVGHLPQLCLEASAGGGVFWWLCLSYRLVPCRARRSVERIRGLTSTWSGSSLPVDKSTSGRISLAYLLMPRRYRQEPQCRFNIAVIAYLRRDVRRRAFGFVGEAGAQAFGFACADLELNYGTAGLDFHAPEIVGRLHEQVSDPRRRLLCANAGDGLSWSGGASPQHLW